MAAFLNVTTETNGLATAIGYWSGDIVYFNLQENTLVIVDQSLRADQLPQLVDDYLAKHLLLDIETTIRGRRFGGRNTFHECIASALLKDFYSISKCQMFDEYKYGGRGKPTWKLVGAAIERKHATEDERWRALASLLHDAVITAPEFLRFDKTQVSVQCLLHPWLRDTLEASRECDRLPVLLAALVHVGSGPQIPKKSRVRAKIGQLNRDLDKVRECGLSIPRISREADVRLVDSFINACSTLLGMLSSQRKIIFPLGVEPAKVMRVCPELSEWEAYSVWRNGYAPKRALMSRLLACSTLRSPADIPENISDIGQSFPDARLLNSTLAPLLLNYGEEKGLEPFPVKKLHRAKARRGAAPSKYGLEWLARRGVPEPWLEFVRLLRRASDAAEKHVRAQARAILDWAWFERKFENPAAILPTELRDPHRPDRRDTFFYFVEKRGLRRKWDFWFLAENAFSQVYNLVLVSDQPRLLENNPFNRVPNPFKTSRPRVTARRRIPNNIHEAMLHVLLSPDERGKPTWTFVRDTLGWDWFDWKNRGTGKSEAKWCPSRARLLALLLLLPIRSKQGRWLDQGLMDDQVWDLDKRAYVPNEHALRNWRHPKSGRTHAKAYGRPSGVLQPATDAVHGDGELCIYVNTNKTQMWDPERVTGYEIWWPRRCDLREEEIERVAKKSDHLARPYEVIEDQIEWMLEHDPDPEPVTFADAADDAAVVNPALRDHYPYFAPIFRDLTSPYYRENGKEYFLPVSKARLARLFSALAVHTEALLAQQETHVAITVPGTGNLAYRGKVCRYDLHSLRVFGVSYLMELGVPWPVVQMIVGHQAPAMTLHYTKASPSYVRRMLTEKASGEHLLGSWNEIGADILRSRPDLIATNPAFADEDKALELLRGDYVGFVQRPGGLCPLGGDACDIGQVCDETKISAGTLRATYGPVNGGCGNCRFFCTSPAHLLQHQMVINDLFIAIRSLGKQQSSLAAQVNELKWDPLPGAEVVSEILDLEAKLEGIEQRLEPMIREWMNRMRMALTTIERLDDYVEFLNHKGAPEKMVLVSASGTDQLAPYIEFRMQKTGEFELARQSLLAAHLQGGIEQCSELSRRQVREFIDRIMIHDDPRHLLLAIEDEKTRDKVAFLMAEAMAATAGSVVVQAAIDRGKGLREMGIESRRLEELETLIEGVFGAARSAKSDAPLSSLLPSGLLEVGVLIGEGR